MKEYKLLSIFMILMFGMSFTACSDDDEDGGSVSGVSNPLLNEGNMLLTSINCLEGDGDTDFYKYSYDEKLRPYKAEGGGDITFLIDYDKGKIMIWDYDEASNLSVSFNSKGYITKINGSWDYKEDGERVYGSLEWTVSYDKDGHLTKIAEKGDIHDEYGGEKYVVNGTLDWKNGCLMSISGDAVYSMDGTDDETSSYTRTFTYGNQKNKFKQFPAIISDDGEFFAVGLYGVGPELLPITMKEEYHDQSVEEINNYSATYTLNANGSIDTENWSFQGNFGNGTMKYVFGYTAPNAISSDNTRSGYVQPWMTSADKAKKVKDFMSKLSFMPKRIHR